MNPKPIHETLYPAYAALVEAISERCYAASWLSGIESFLWGACAQLQQHPELAIVPYGQDEVTRAEAMALLQIAEIAGGWWLGDKFVEWETWSKDFRETTGKQSPYQPNTAGHHGAPIITQQDVSLLSTMVRWIEVVRGAGEAGWLSPGSKAYGEGWLPSGVDIIKSRLFWRLRTGAEPLFSPPPTAFSCPWHEVIENDHPHWCYEDVQVYDGTGNDFYPYPKTVYIWFYTCDKCGRRSVWSSAWAWFGSYEDMENGKDERIFYSCSPKCRQLSRREIASITRGLAKCGPADLMQQLKDARSWKEDVADKQDMIERLDKCIASAYRKASMALHNRGTDPEQALREIMCQLKTSNLFEEEKNA